MGEREQHRVVVGIDGSADSVAALNAAADEASLRGAPLHIVHSYVPPPAYMPLTPYPPMVNTAAAVLRRLLADAMASTRRTHRTVAVSTQLVTGRAASSLIQMEAALVVVGRRGTGGFAGLLAGSTSVQVASHAHCPVMVVSAPFESSLNLTGGEIVVGTDGHERTSAAIAFAFAEASLRSLPLVALTAGQSELRVPHLRPAYAYAGSESRADIDLDRVQAEALSGWRDKYPQVRFIRRFVPTLDPLSALVEASRQATMVVVGSRGRGIVRSVMLGSVGYNLINHAQSPVVIAHEPQQGALS